VIAVVVAVLMIVSHQHGVASSQLEISALKQRLGHEQGKSGGSGRQHSDSGRDDAIVAGGTHIRTIGGRSHTSNKKSPITAEPSTPKPPAPAVKLTPKRPPAHTTILATDAPEETDEEGLGDSKVVPITPAPDETEDIDETTSAPTLDSDPIVTVARDPEHPALIVHTYHDAKTMSRVQSAIDRPYPSFKLAKPAKFSSKHEATIDSEAWSRAVYDSVKRAWEDPAAPNVVPTMVVPLFHDGSELLVLLASIDAPVRLFVFVWNSNSAGVKRAVDVLKLFPFGVVVHHTPDNVGFSGAVNTGIRSSRNFLPEPAAQWYFIVNADTEFPRDVLGNFAAAVNALEPDTYGLVYGPRQDHFAFVITKVAVDTVGYFDEVFYPGYMEDIDYHWRVRLGGLRKRITGAKFRHKKSANDRKPKSVTGDYQGMLIRMSRGWEYGWMKWGKYGMHQIEKDFPPSGWRTPFNIPDAPLSLWALDPGVRSCVRTGKGTYHVKSSTCWYNGNFLKPKLPKGTILSPNLVKPGPTGR
jgi:glycosyltransferase involved in cell wall biosynthesis